jgi:hypothetical protein
MRSCGVHSRCASHERRFFRPDFCGNGNCNFSSRRNAIFAQDIDIYVKKIAIPSRPHHSVSAAAPVCFYRKSGEDRHLASEADQVRDRRPHGRAQRDGAHIATVDVQIEVSGSTSILFRQATPDLPRASPGVWYSMGSRKAVVRTSEPEGPQRGIFLPFAAVAKSVILLTQQSVRRAGSRPWPQQ